MVVQSNADEREEERAIFSFSSLVWLVGSHLLPSPWYLWPGFLVFLCMYVQNFRKKVSKSWKYITIRYKVKIFSKILIALLARVLVWCDDLYASMKEKMDDGTSERMNEQTNE